MAERRERSRRYRVLGIDPGLVVSGYAAVDFTGGQPAIVEAGTVTTDSEGDLAARIAQIHADLSAILGELGPDLAAVEELYGHYKHPRTAILMGHARGVVLLACRQAGVDVRNLSATNIKKNLTGNGHASKEQVQRVIQSVCGLSELPEPTHVADALAIALCAGRYEGRTRSGVV